jgi:DNA-binding CsgD family transcriptional regulator/PAS domain-containing protein
LHQNAVLELIQHLYAAPGTATGWRTFLEALRTSTGASSANLISHFPLARSSDIAAAAGTGADPEGATLYEEHWSAQDPWAYSPRLSPLTGTVFVGDALIPQGELRRTAFYADFGRRFDVVQVVGATIDAGAAGASVISINGSERRQPFSAAETALLTALMPHMQQALRLHRRILDAEQASNDLTGIIERSNRAIFVIDAGGRIVFLNGAAALLASKRDGIAIDQGELHGADGNTTTGLRRLMADAIRTSTAGGGGAGGVMTMGKPSGRRALVALVSPVSAADQLPVTTNRPAALVLITDPESSVLIDALTLRKIFGLTPAEAKLTRLLTAGISLYEAAARLGLSRETVRTRIKVIFEKTGTHRQAELVSLVIRAFPQV